MEIGKGYKRIRVCLALLLPTRFYSKNIEIKRNIGIKIILPFLFLHFTL